MAALREHLRLIPPQRPLWCSPAVGRLRAVDLACWLKSQQQLAEPLRGKSVGVLAQRDLDCAALLLLLDGTCSQLTLLPATNDLALLRSILATSESELVLSAESSETARELGADLIDTRTLEPTVAARAELKPSQASPSIWILPTSGTTGRPKLVAHTLESLTRTVKKDLDRGGQFAWGSLYNLNSFAGLQVFLQSWFGGSRLILARRDTTLAQRVDDLIAQDCNALSATPTMWRMLLMSTRIAELPLRQITLGGEPVDQRILDTLAKTFPKARIVHIYASTEAGVGFAVTDRRAGFPASFLESPPSGVQLRVDARGRLGLKADVPEQRSMSCDANCRDRDGFIDSDDLVRRQGDRFLFLGRSSGLINVGGQKVHPQEVESVLLSCPEVKLARVFARKSPFVGSLVQAEIVTFGQALDLSQEIEARAMAHCRNHLEPYKVPAIIKVVDSIDLTASGKLARTS